MKRYRPPYPIPSKWSNIHLMQHGLNEHFWSVNSYFNQIHNSQNLVSNLVTIDERNNNSYRDNDTIEVNVPEHSNINKNYDLTHEENIIELDNEIG